MSYELIKTNRRFDGQVCEIVIGPPPGNIVTAKLIDEMSEEFKRYETPTPETRNTKLIVVTGEGKHFSYGASVEEHKPALVADMLPRFHRLIGRILDCDVPTLAQVSGLCLGGAFEIVMACAMTMCDQRAKFGVPEIQLGVFPPVAAVILPHLVSYPEACRLILTGENYTAADMLRLGLVTSVDTPEELPGAVNQFIETHILPKSASSLRFACRVARRTLADHYRSNIPVVEKIYLDELMATTDAVEGIESFLQKRAPTWKNV